MAESGRGILLDKLFYELGIEDDKFKDGLAQARDASARAAKEMLRAEMAAEKAAEKLAKLEKSGKASGEALDRAKRGAEIAARELEKAKEAADGAAKGLEAAEKQAGRFAKFGGAATLSIAAGVGAALVAMTLKAVRLAAELEAAVIRIQNVVPGAEGAFDRLSQVIERTAERTGRTREEIIATADALAQGGVESVDDFANRLEVVSRAADASGGSIVGIAGGLDQVLDLFGLTADQAERVVATIVQLGKGRAPIEDVFNTLAFAAPALSRLGLDFETASAALTTLVNNGFKVRQAGSELAKYAELGDEGRAAIQKLAEQSRGTADALTEMNEAAERTRASAQRAEQVLRNDFNAALGRLGTVILPTVNKGLQILADILGTVLSQGSGPPKAITDATVAVDALGSKIDEVKAKVPPGSDLATLLGLRAAGAPATPPPTATTPPATGTGGTAGSGLNVKTPEQIRAEQEAAAKALEDAKRAREEAKRETEEAARALERLARDLAVATATAASETLGQFTRLVTDYEAKLKDLPEKARAAGEASLRQLRDLDLRQLAIKVAAEFEVPDGPEAEAFKVEARALLIEAFTVNPDTIQKVVAQLERQAGFLRAQDAARKGLAKSNEEVERQEKEIARAKKEAADKERDALRNSRDQARALADAAQGALNLAEAFGIVSDSTRDTLNSIIQIGTGIGPLLKVIEQMKKVGEDGKPLAGLTELVGAALPVAGAVASLVGGLFGGSPDPNVEEQKKRQKENTEAIRELTDAVNSFTDVTSGGAVFARARTNLNNANIIKGIIKDNDRQGIGELGRLLSGKDSLTESEFARFGISLQDFAKLAKDAGIQVRDGLPTLQDVLAVGKALKQQEFNRFAETFGGQLDKLQRGFRLFGTGQQGQFDGLVKLLTDPTKGAPALFGALRGINLGSAGGIEQATKVIRDLFTNFENLDPSQFGGLGPEEFLGVLEQLLGIVQGGEGGGLSAFAKALADLREGFRVFDVDDPAKQAKATLDVLDDFSPALRGLLAGVDTSTTAGLAEARSRLQAFYQQVKDGVVTLETEGGLSIEELIATIELLGAVTGATVETLRQRLGTLSQELDARGITNPIEQFAYTFERIADVAPAVAAALADLDLTTAEGLKEADRILGTLFFAARDGLIPTAAEDILAFQDLIRGALNQMVSDADKATKDYEQAMEKQRQEAEAAARAAEAAAEAARRERFATADRAIAQLRNENALFDIADPVAQVRKLVDVLKEGAPIFGQILGDADVSTTEGRASALEALRRFFLENPNGLESGFFSSDQVLGQVLDLGELLKQAGVSGDITNSGESTSFAVNQQITSVQGDRIFGAIGTTNILLGSIDARLAAIAVALGVTGGGGVLPPVLPSGASTTQAGGPGTMVFNAYLGGQLTSATLSAELQGELEALMQRIAREVILSGQGV